MNAESIARALGGRKTGGDWMARCPAHDTREPSMPTCDADEGKVLALCHAGSDQHQVVGALNGWRDELAQWFKGLRVCILPDNDKPGRDLACKIAKSLHGIADTVKVVELPGLKENGDVSDFLKHDTAGIKLLDLCRKAPLMPAVPWPDLLRVQISTPARQMVQRITVPDSIRRCLCCDNGSQTSGPLDAALDLLARQAGG